MAGEANVDSSHILKKRKYLSGTTDANFQHQSQCIRRRLCTDKARSAISNYVCKLPHNWFIIEYM